VVLAVVALVLGALAVAAVVGALLHLGGRIRAGFGAIEALAASAARQGEDLRRLGEVSAQSVRIASGAYVFELRDRFDAALGLVQVGVAETAWTAAHADGSEADEPIALVVLEPGDTARARIRLVLSQAPVRRVVRARWTDVPGGTRSVRPVELHAASGSSGPAGFELPSDLSLFADGWLDVDVHALGPGPFERVAGFEVTVSDVRPEGAVATVPVRLVLRGVVVPDGDGLGLDAATVEGEVQAEVRTYFLVKDEGLPLDLPRVPAVL
jgi:hypothetical protein